MGSEYNITNAMYGRSRPGEVDMIVISGLREMPSSFMDAVMLAANLQVRVLLFGFMIVL